MTSAKKTPSKKSTAESRSAKTDAIKLLTEDHKEVRALFKDYEKLVKDEAPTQDRENLAQQICRLLTVHTALEEELFYPTAREALEESENDDLVDEATVEHASAKELIAQIESADPDDSLYDAKVKVLGEYIEHHVKEEEGEMFPKVKKTDLDLEVLGEQLSERKEELLEENADQLA